MLQEWEFRRDVWRVGFVIDHAVQERSELRLERGELRADEPAAEHPRLEPDLVHGPHHPGRVGRVRREEDDIRIGRLDGAHYGREVDGVGWVALVVDHLEPGALGLRARAFQRQRRILGVGTDQRDGLRLGIECHRRVEEPLRPADRRLRACRHDLEITVVVEFRVDVETEQRHERHVPLHDDRHCGSDDVRTVPGDEQVDLVDVEQLVVDARHRRGVGLVVVVDELDLTAEKAATGVDVLGPDLHRDQRRLAVAGERSGEAHAEADLQRLLRLHRSAERQREGDEPPREPSGQSVHCWPPPRDK